MRPYACGMCKKMFEIKQGFTELGFYHCYDDPEKNTPLKLFQNFILKPYGCGMCGELFERETEFLQHFYNHYCEDPQKGIHLLNCLNA